MKGMPAKPAALRALEGGTKANGAVSHRPIPAKVEVAPVLEDTEPPAELGPAGKTLWREVVAELIKIGMVTTADRPAVILMCRHWEHVVGSQRTLEEDGYYSEGSMGQMVVHPAMRVFLDSSTAYLRFAQHFGLTPSARVKLGLNDAARRTLQADLEDKLGYNPRKVNVRVDG